MSANDWIPLTIHPGHVKVRRLSVLTGEDKFTACGRAVAWFRWIDQNLPGPETGLDRPQVNEICGVDGPVVEGRLDWFDAMADEYVQWIGHDAEGFAVVQDFDKWFSKSAKQRVLKQRRRELHRAKQSEAAESREPGPKPAQPRPKPSESGNGMADCTGGHLLQRLGLASGTTLYRRAVENHVSGMDVVKVWGERHESDRDPQHLGPLIAKVLLEDGSNGRASMRAVAEAARDGVVETLLFNGQTIDVRGREVRFSKREGLKVDGKVVVPSDRMDELEVA